MQKSGRVCEWDKQNETNERLERMNWVEIYVEMEMWEGIISYHMCLWPFLYFVWPKTHTHTM